MLSLPNLQLSFRDAHFQNDFSEASKLIVENNLTSVQRLNIYKNNTFITLTEALSKTYPVIQKLVGEDFFKYMASEFIRAHPPVPGPLFEYGGNFPDFLSHFEPASSLIYLSDVAQLEWAINTSYHAAEGNSLIAHDLQNVPEEKLTKLRLTLHPSLRIITSEFPIDKIWHSNQDGAEEVEIDLTNSVEILVIRPSDTVNIHITSTGTSHFLRSINLGQNIEAAYTSAAAEDHDFNPEKSIIHLLEIGTFVDFKIDPAL